MEGIAPSSLILHPSSFRCGPSSTTRYAFGVYEVEGAITRTYYSLAGQVIAVRDSGLGLSSLYGDQLGSISASTNASGAALRTQSFDAWGKRLAGSIPATDRSFTGQYLDDTGLLFYHARYYDPGMGRFVSADSIVPGAAALTLTGGSGGGGPSNPQQLNRFTYVLNNPIRHTDPSGHGIGWVWGATDCQLAQSADQLDWQGGAHVVHTGLDVAGMLPGVGAVPDLINAGLYAAQGDYVNAALSGTAAMPGLGDFATAAKYSDEAAGLVGAVCSFDADTPVLTENGTAPIAELEVGDTVLAYHEGTGETALFPVTATWSHLDPIVVTLVIDGEVIETTPEHPFFVAGRGWTPAEQVVAGTAIQQADGTTGIVQATQVEQRTQEMFNLTIADAHTYFVGEQGWLVHNACGGKIPLIGGGTNLPKGSEWTNVNDIVHGNPPDVADKLNNARAILKDGWDPKRFVGIDILPDGTKVARNGNHRLAITKEMGYDQIPTRVLRDQRGKQ